MKLVTNYAPARRNVAAILAPMLAIGALTLAVSTVFMAMDIVALRSRSADVGARIAALQSDTKLSAPAARQAMQDLSTVRTRIQAVNTLVGLRGGPTLSLLDTFEHLLPDRAYFVSLHRRTEAGEVLMVVAADTAAPLTEFLRALEREPRFQQVLLLHQSPRSSREAGGVQFEIRIKERV